MLTSLNKYLDPAALDETVVNIRQIVESLEEEMQNLPYARPDGLYPDMTVGAVIGADETAQWAQRVTAGSGAATVRSVQGASVVWSQLIKPNNPRSVTSKGVTYTSTSDGKVTLDGTATDTESFTSSLAFSVVNGHKYLYKGADTSRGVFAAVIGIGNNINSESIYTATADVASTTISVAIAATYTGTYECYPQLFDLTAMFGSGNEPTTVAEFEQMYPEPYYPYSAPTLKPVQINGIRSTDAQGGELDSVEWTAQTLRAAGSVRDELTADHVDVRVGERAYQSGDESDATVRTDGTTTYYPLATPTITPISPALPMTYRVEQGGTEAIIVPDGETNAAPVLTVAEPVNAGAEFARIWAAIESLGYTRNTAQLSRPVSLTDIGSIDEVQNDTTEIETTKEVKE